MPKWLAYIPDDGNWDINYTGNDARMAKASLRLMLQTKRLPPGTKVFIDEEPKHGRHAKMPDKEYWRAMTELKAELNRPLPGGRGFQHQRDRTIHRLCAEIAGYETPER